MSLVPAAEEDYKAGKQMGFAKENVQNKSASSSNFHKRRSYVDPATKKGGHCKNLAYTAAQQHIDDSTNLMKHHKLFAPSLKIDTNHVQNVIAATTNYLRKSVETSSPASTISNITPTSTNIDYLSTHEKKSNSGSSTTDVCRNAYPVSIIADAPKHLNDNDRRTTLVSGPRIISESHCDMSHGVHNNDSNLQNSMGRVRPLSAVSRSSAANSIGFNRSRGLASPLGRMILRSPSPSAVNHSNNNSSGNKNNVTHFLESKSTGSSKINNMVECESRSSSLSASWSMKLDQFERNVNDSNAFKRKKSSNPFIRESFSSSSDDVSLDIETSSFEDSIIDRRNKPDFQRSRSVDFVNQQMLSNAKKSGNKKGRIQTREKSLSSDISFDGEIRSISIRRKLSEVRDGDDGNAFLSSIDRSTVVMQEKDPGHENRFKSISNSRKRQQDGSPCEFEAPPKITAKSNISSSYNNNANNEGGGYVPSPPQKIRQHFVHSDLDLPPLRRTLSPNFMQGARGRSRVIVPRGSKDSSLNNVSENMIQERFLSVKHLPSPSPPAKIVDPAVIPIVTKATTIDPNNVDICGLSSLDDDDGRQSMPPPLPISTPLPMEEPEFLLPTVDSGNGCTLKTVSCETVNRLLNGDFNDTIKKYIIVDCRFEYEYTGGHILNAINIVKPEHAIEKFFKEQIHDIDTCILFHCEFSSHRAPKMMKEVRNLDRKLHENSYPQLYYPQLYLIKGGYKEFYKNFIDKCEPRAYVEMLHGDFKDVCKSTASLVRKSWKRHKSFDMDLLRHSSPALLSTINQFDSTNVERSNCENNMGNRCDIRNKRLRKPNKSLSTFPRTRRGINLFANDDENNHGNGRSNIVSSSIINRTTSFSEGYADIAVPPLPFFDTCRSSDKERQRDDEREANTF